MITYYTKEGKFINSNLDNEPLPMKKLHREDGPALIYSFGVYVWFKEGKLHRLDGPAYISNTIAEKTKEYFINNKKLNIEETESWIKNNNINLKKKEHQILFMLKFG